MHLSKIIDTAAHYGQQHLLIISILLLGFYANSQSEISFEVGYFYNNSSILANPDEIFIIPEDVSLKILPGLNIGYTYIGDVIVHRVKIGVNEFQHSRTISSNDLLYNSSSSRSYWNLSYLVGKEWSMFSNKVLAFNQNLGFMLLTRQNSALNFTTGTIREFDIDGRPLQIEQLNDHVIKNSFAFVSESILKVNLNKRFCLKLGLNLFLWTKPIYGDIEYGITFDGIEKSNSIIRSKKSLCSLMLGFVVKI